jgi:hypothetical protein
MHKHSAKLLLGFLLASPSWPAFAQQPPIDYGNDATWLCRPGRQDACAVDLSATIVAADGKTSVEQWQGRPDAPVDCFYVYPTVSQDPTPNSDMTPNAPELNVARQQIARFGSQCRIYAPLYRQVTIGGLQRLLAGAQPVTLDGGMAYDDVLNAWRHYLLNDNHGRGVVLVGHSQGSALLSKLIAQEIDGKSVQRLVVSALVLGWPIAVPKNETVGGAFKHLPLCQSADQIQCVVAYSSFRATAQPPANSLFGRIPGTSLRAACVNPAALSGKESTLRAYLPSAVPANAPWVAGGGAISTPFVAPPELLSGQCVDNGELTYLSVTVHGNPNDPRTDTIVGDIVVAGQTLPQWGLHLIDVNLALGDLVDLVGRQVKAYQAAVRDCGCHK